MNEVRVITVVWLAFVAALALVPLARHGIHGARKWWQEYWLVYVALAFMWFAALLWARELMR